MAGGGLTCPPAPGSLSCTVTYPAPPVWLLTPPQHHHVATTCTGQHPPTCTMTDTSSITPVSPVTALSSGPRKALKSPTAASMPSTSPHTWPGRSEGEGRRSLVAWQEPTGTLCTRPATREVAPCMDCLRAAFPAHLSRVVGPLKQQGAAEIPAHGVARRLQPLPIGHVVRLPALCHRPTGAHQRQRFSRWCTIQGRDVQCKVQPALRQAGWAGRLCDRSGVGWPMCRNARPLLHMENQHQTALAWMVPAMRSSRLLMCTSSL